jgi:hypothetical protein
VSVFYNAVDRAVTTNLVPNYDRLEDTLVELLELSSLVLGTLVVGLGHVEVSLRVGDTFYPCQLDITGAAPIRFLTGLVRQFRNSPASTVFGLSSKTQGVPDLSAG